jgi:hypothetical protein
MRSITSILALTTLVAIAAQTTRAGDNPRTDEPAPRPTTRLARETGEEWPLCLSEAIRLALDESRLLRVVDDPGSLASSTDQDNRIPDPLFGDHPWPRNCCYGSRFTTVPMTGAILIRPAKADTPIWRFRADVMALVRSVEQQYWLVSAHRVRVACTEQLVKSATDVVQKEQGEFTCRGSALHIVEAIERLEQFQKDLKSQTTSLADADRRLRMLLGIPQSDGRHIVTATRPIDQPVGCQWDRCRTELVRMQVNVLDQTVVKALCDATAVRPAQSSSGWMEPRPSAMRAMYEQKETQEAKEWSDAIQRQIRALETCCSAVDAAYRQYQQAKQHRSAAARRLETGKVHYDEGRITAARYLDFVSQHADAVAAEANRASEYNTAIAALGEAKGTLLADRFILVIDQPLRLPNNWVARPGGD